MQEFLGQEIYMTVQRHVGAAVRPAAAEDVRPAFALALEALEREGKIPGEAPELRDVGEGVALADLRAGLENMWHEIGSPHYRAAIGLLDFVAAKHRPPTGRLANDLQEALRLQGVNLGPDATEAVVKALASLEGEAL
jgi:hypothetical protein